MKKVLFALFTVSMVVISSCKKEDMSKYATKEDLANLKGDTKADVYHFSLTFGPGKTMDFAPTIHKDSPNDIVLTFTQWDEIGGAPTWVQCPFTNGNISVIPEFMDYSLIINVIRADAQPGSPLTQNMSFNFKAVVIPVSGLAEKPNVDLTNYEEVKKAFID